MLICCKIIIFTWSTEKNYPFGNNVFGFYFINPPQNHCLFHRSPAKVMLILEITGKKNCVYWITVMRGKNEFHLLGMKLPWIYQSAIEWIYILIIGLRNACLSIFNVPFFILLLLVHFISLHLVVISSLQKVQLFCPTYASCWGSSTFIPNLGS